MFVFCHVYRFHTVPVYFILSYKLRERKVKVKVKVFTFLSLNL
jgi:hypothetical protein